MEHAIQALLAQTRERAMDGYGHATCFRIVPPLRWFEKGCRLVPMALLAGLLAATAAGDALSAIACKPLLSIGKVRDLRAPPVPQPWTWTATIVADTSYCATTSGKFEIDFIRIKEYAPDVQFTEPYQWVPGRFQVNVELAADEAVLKYRIGFIAPCVCRALPFEK
jgi:hypothetical protein